MTASFTSMHRFSANSLSWQLAKADLAVHFDTVRKWCQCTANAVPNKMSLFQICELRTETAEGLAKLMYCGRILSPKLLSRLVLLWYNPVTEDDQRLRQLPGGILTAVCPGQQVYMQGDSPSLNLNI